MGRPLSAKVGRTTGHQTAYFAWQIPSSSFIHYTLRIKLKTGSKFVNAPDTKGLRENKKN